MLFLFLLLFVVVVAVVVVVVVVCFVLVIVVVVIGAVVVFVFFVVVIGVVVDMCICCLHCFVYMVIPGSMLKVLGCIQNSTVRMISVEGQQQGPNRTCGDHTLRQIAIVMQRQFNLENFELVHKTKSKSGNFEKYRMKQESFDINGFRKFIVPIMEDVERALAIPSPGNTSSSSISNSTNSSISSSSSRGSTSSSSSSSSGSSGSIDSTERELPFNEQSPLAQQTTEPSQTTLRLSTEPCVANSGISVDVRFFCYIAIQLSSNTVVNIVFIICIISGRCTEFHFRSRV